MTFDLLEERLVPSAGELDPTFSGDGRATTHLMATSAVDRYQDVVVQPDGKIIAVGDADGSSALLPDFSLTRYNPDGSLDLGFGADGQLISDFGGFSKSKETAFAVSVLGDGKLLVAGSAAAGGSGKDFDFAVARYNPDGSVDSTFGTAGKVITDFPATGDEDEGLDLVVMPDGKFVVAGTSASTIALARYHADGTLDTSFDGDGLVTTNLGAGSERAEAVALQGTKIVVAGTTGSDFALLRYNADGSLDDSFDSDGIVTTDFGISSNESARDVVIDSSNHILLVGGGVGAPADFLLARYDANGVLDNSFDGDGRVRTTFGFTVDAAEAVQLEDDGQIVVTGGVADFVVARYNTDGTLDTTFGTNGSTQVNLGASSDRARALPSRAMTGL